MVTKASHVDIFEKLALPFSPERVSWRVGSTKADKSTGMALAYIDARDVMERLDEVVGPDNWQDRYEIHGGKTICYLSIRFDPINNEWITKADGAGDSDIEAEKGALSDAFKRVAVKWGIGRYLYDLSSPWVQLDTYQGKDGKTYVKGIKTEEMGKLRASLAQADPEARATIWAQDNAAMVKRALNYPGAAEIFAEAGINTTKA